eukprot:COSAG01_NODE_2185_length_8205_cov_92.522576_1_plen_687_part_00
MLDALESFATRWLCKPRCAFARPYSTSKSRKPDMPSTAGEAHEDDFLGACAAGDAARIIALAEAGCDTTATRTSDGSTGLMLAAVSGSAAAVKAVLALGGAELEATNKDGGTAFLWACQWGKVQCITALAEAGCDPTTRDGKKGLTGLMLAASSGSAAAVEAVLALGGAGLEATDNNRGSTAFLWACDQGKAQCITALAEAGCDTTARRTSDGSTGLMLAAGSGSAAAVMAMLEVGGAELEAANKHGATAFLWACNRGEAQCITALAEAGCDTTARDRDGATGLVNAVVSTSVAAVTAVLELGGAELDAKDNRGYTAFLRACVCGSVECMEVLAENGCDTLSEGKRQRDGLSAMKVACQCQLANGNTRGTLEEVHRVIKFLQGRQKRRQWLRETEAFMASGQYAKALELVDKLSRVIDQTQLSAGETVELGRLRAEAQSAHAQQLERAEEMARRHEAELMAMLDGKRGAVPTDNEAQAEEKARKKKEKKRRQRQRRQEKTTAALVSTQVPSQQSSPLPTCEPEPEPTAEVSGSGMPHSEPADGPQPEPVQVKVTEPAVPMAELTMEQVVAWLASVTGLTHDIIETVGQVFKQQEIDGDDLETMRPKRLRRVLKGHLAEGEKAEAVTAAVLAQRDLYLVATQKKTRVAKYDDDVPSLDFVCPLSLCLMNDPWTTQAGSTCEQTLFRA